MRNNIYKLIDINGNEIEKPINGNRLVRTPLVERYPKFALLNSLHREKG